MKCRVVLKSPTYNADPHRRRAVDRTIASQYGTTSAWTIGTFDGEVAQRVFTW
jgi:hypothetical protein